MSTKAPAKATIHRARIPADAMAVLFAQVVALLGVWAWAIVVSFTGLVAAAGWANITGFQRYGVPLFIDGILVGASLAYLVARERHDRASQAISVLAMLAFCGLSITGNAVHALASGALGIQRTVGVLLAVAAPIAILTTTELLARTVIASPDEHVPAPASRAARRVAQQAVQAAPAPVLEAATPVATQAEQARTQRQNANTQGRDATDRSRRVYTPEQRQEALALAAQGMSQRQIAEQVDASKSAVQAWLAAGVGAAA